ncbi:hypothetical protein [Alteromonas stellipolaris]|uniref:hypothetical protein n=1 Tax=Alteromonas stellipolaris TaxID=233316 RepID=UPI00273317DD|nr:hypothetical protein [Alteromonas stellipolaris]MDP2594680.1 hypothetical protein [Alteromonas stellipolaris]
MKSTKFGLGYEQNKNKKKQRLTILVLLTTLVSLDAILLSMVLVFSNTVYHAIVGSCTQMVQLIN